MRKNTTILLAILLAQTTQTQTIQIDLSILYNILPIMISLMVIVLIFGIISGFFKSLGDMFKGAFRFVRSTVPLAPALLVAQTQTPQIDISIIYTILPLMITIMVFMLIIGLISGMFRSIGDAMGSAFKNSVNRNFRKRVNPLYALPLITIAQTVPAQELYGQALNILNILLPVMIALLLLIVLILQPIRVFRELVSKILE